jgi:hypothetical protein
MKINKLIQINLYHNKNKNNNTIFISYMTTKILNNFILVILKIQFNLGYINTEMHVKQNKITPCYINILKINKKT